MSSQPMKAVMDSVLSLSGTAAATSSGSRTMYSPEAISYPLTCSSRSTGSPVSLSTKTRRSRLPVLRFSV